MANTNQSDHIDSRLWKQAYEGLNGKEDGKKLLLPLEKKLSKKVPATEAGNFHLLDMGSWMTLAIIETSTCPR